MNETVSIIVPVYNAERFLRHTMDSVRAQTYTDWELLLVDDCSTDGSAQLIEEYAREKGDSRIRLISQPSNLGAAKARNRGVEEAQGRYIAYLDADDLWESVKLEHQLAFLQKEEAAFTFTGYEFADENGVGLGKIVRVPKTLEYREALKNTTIFTTTVMFDTEKIPKELLSMPQIRSEDTALWWRILRSGYTAYGLDENLARYRRTGGTLSSNKLIAIQRIWNLYRKAEGMNRIQSAWNFCFWAFRAVYRRI